MNLTKRIEAAGVPFHAPEAKGHEANDLDFPAGERHRKEESTLLARLALVGFVADIGVCGDFLVRNHLVSHYCHDLDALREVVHELEVRCQDGLGRALYG